MFHILEKKKKENKTKNWTQIEVNESFSYK